jgi:hypothetical protein
MFATQMPTRRKRHTKQHGKGVGNDILNSLKKVHNFAKKTGIVSKLAGVVGAAGFAPAAKLAAGARLAGYGKVRKLRTG